MTGLLEDGLCGDLAAMVAGGEPINSHLARGAAPWPPGHIDVTDSLAPGRGRSGRARFARAVPGYGLNEALADLILVLIVGVNCYLGWRHGLVRRAIACVAVYGGTLAAYYVGELGVVLLVIQAVADAPPSTANVSSAIRTAPAIAVDHGVLTQVIVDLEPGINRLLSPAIPSNIQNRLDQYSAG